MIQSGDLRVLSDRRNGCSMWRSRSADTDTGELSDREGLSGSAGGTCVAGVVPSSANGASSMSWGGGVPL